MTSSVRGSVLFMLLGGVLWSTPGLSDGLEGPAQAQENAAAIARLMDANGDGQISEAEFSRLNALPGRFAALDADGDGVLDQDEQQGINVGPRIRR